MKVAFGSRCSYSGKPTSPASYSFVVCISYKALCTCLQQKKTCFVQQSPKKTINKQKNIKTRFTIGKCSNDVAFTGIVGKIGPTTSPITETRALFEPYT